MEEIVRISRSRKVLGHGYDSIIVSLDAGGPWRRQDGTKNAVAASPASHEIPAWYISGNSDGERPASTWPYYAQCCLCQMQPSEGLIIKGYAWHKWSGKSGEVCKDCIDGILAVKPEWEVYLYSEKEVIRNQ